MEESKHTLTNNKIEDLRGFSFLPIILLFVFLFALGYAERMVYFENPVRGVILHAYILFGLIMIVSAYWDKSQYYYLMAFAIVPFMRIIGFAVPLSYLQISAWYVLVSLALIVAVMMVAQRLELTRFDLGLKFNKLPLQIVVGFSGILIGAGQYLIVMPSLSTDPMLQFPSIAIGVVVLLGYSFVEELIFRGMLQHSLEKVLGAGVAWVYTAAVYAVMTFGSYSFVNIAFAFGYSLLFSWVVWQTKSIVGVALAHGLLNITMFLIVPGLNL